MDSFKARAAHGPEFYIQNKWVEFLTNKKWHVERMVGNAFQTGIPDLYLGHPKYGTRWVDVKVYGRYSFTKAQRRKWPIWEKHKIGIWIIGANSSAECTTEHMQSDYETILLKNAPNWRDFWKEKWDYKQDIDKMLKDLNNEDGNK